jgi:hypothetical protein
MGTYHLICVSYLFFIQIFHPRTFIRLGFHFFPYTYLTLKHKSFFHVSLSALHSAMFFYLLGQIIVFGYNSHQTRQFVPIVVMVIYEIFECYCECWGRISRYYWNQRWKNFLSIHNNQINVPINKYFYPLSCVLLVFIIVVVFIFILFGVVFQVYGTRCITLKLCCKNRFAWIILGFWFRVVNFKIHQRKKFIIHGCKFVNHILEFSFSHCKSKSKW